MTVLFGCAVCFGSMHSGVKLVMLGLLLLPFVMVGGMLGLLYARGALATPPADAAVSSSTPTGNG